MYYIRYYKGEKVYVTGTYSIGFVNYSIIEDVNGNESVVHTADLEHDRPEQVVSSVNVTSEGVEISGRNIKIDGETTEAFEKSFEGASESIVTYGRKLNPDKPVEEEGGVKTTVESDKHTSVVVTKPSEIKATITTKIVTAINKKGKRTKLGLIDQLSESPAVKRLGLNPEAIQLVLDGKQKQHKGFTFDIK